MNKKKKGLIIVLLCSLLWAFNGNIGGWLFQEKNFTPDILVASRLLGTGLSLIVINALKNGKAAFHILQVKSNYIRILAYGLAGILIMQYSYFTAILYSNAPTSTLLQYIGIFLIILFVSIQQKKIPDFKIFIAMFFCIIGVLLLVTHGDLSSLLVNQKTLFWGLLSAFGLANSSLAPISLQARYKPIDIVGPSMLLAGLILTLLVRPDYSSVIWDASSISALLYCVFGGTLLPFVFYMEGQKRTGAALASIFALAEPVFATVIAVFLYGTIFLGIDLLGMVLIFASILLLTLEDSKDKA